MRGTSGSWPRPFAVGVLETTPTGTGFLAAELLVSRTDADALVTRGPVDDDWTHAVADRHRLVIRRAHSR